MPFTFSTVSLWLATWPYFWTFRKYNLRPIQTILSSRSDPERLTRAIEGFVAEKRRELNFINIAVRFNISFIPLVCWI